MTVTSHEHEGFLKQGQLHCLYSSWLRITTKKTSKPRITGPWCDRWFPSTEDTNWCGHLGWNCAQHMYLNTLRTRQNGRHFPDDIFKWIFLNENVWIPTDISPKFVPRGPINNIPTLVQVMAWRRPGDKPLSEPMMVRLPTHIRHSASMS